MDKSETVKPFRITYSVQNKEGLSGLLTISYDSLKELQTGMDECETWLSISQYKGKESGYQNKPQAPKYAPQATSQGGGASTSKDKNWIDKPCPKDGGRLYSMQTKTGKTMIKCENSKWDFRTSTASGCDYVEWPKEY